MKTAADCLPAAASTYLGMVFEVDRGQTHALLLQTACNAVSSLMSLHAAGGATAELRAVI